MRVFLISHTFFFGEQNNHINRLYGDIRKKAIIQYFSPFLSVRRDICVCVPRARARVCVCVCVCVCVLL